MALIGKLPIVSGHYSISHNKHNSRLWLQTKCSVWYGSLSLCCSKTCCTSLHVLSSITLETHFLAHALWSYKILLALAAAAFCLWEFAPPPNLLQREPLLLDIKHVCKHFSKYPYHGSSLVAVPIFISTFVLVSFPAHFLKMAATIQKMVW